MTDAFVNRPEYWFVASDVPLRTRPDSIEFLRAGTGETFIHCGGSVYWTSALDYDPDGGLDARRMQRSGITHYRVVHPSRLEEIVRMMRALGE